MWAIVSGTPIRDESGVVRGAFAMMVDITERKRFEEDLRESEERFRTLVEQIPEAIFVQSGGRFVFLNPAAGRLFGISKAEDLLGGELMERIAPEYREAIRERIRFQRETGRSVPLMEQEFLRIDGSRVAVETMAMPIHFQGCDANLVSVRDITERRKAEDAIRHYQRQLKALVAELFLTEEHQRRRLATDLHDHVGQTLAAAKIKIGVLQESVPSPRLKGSLKEIREIIEQAIRDTRLLTAELSPPVLSQLGFDAAIEWVADEMKKLLSLKVTIQSDDHPKPMTEEVRTVLFQAVREALINVAKHSGVLQARVSIHREDATVRVAVADRGVGFDPFLVRERQTDEGGFGLFNLRERIEHLGGQFIIESAPKKGTRIIFIVPLKPD